MSIERETAGQPESQASEPFAYLYPQKYVLLQTFRKSGDAVATTVWFANENGRLYITTSPVAGKVKRIRSNGRVTMTPCNGSGKVIGDGREVAGKARELPVNERSHPDQLLAHKYGFMYNILGFVMKLRKMQNTIIEIEPVQ